jgi:hypothetical protein
MTLTDMRVLVRRDLNDENESDYRWTDNELDRHIARAVKEFSEAIPLEQKATLATTAGSREITIVGLTNRVMVEAIEYPTGKFPESYQRFAVWNETITLLGEDIPNGSNCYVYYGKLHALDGINSTIPCKYEDLIATGAAGYAAYEGAIHAVNRVNTGGTGTPEEFKALANDYMTRFRTEIKRLNRNNHVRFSQLYIPYNNMASKSMEGGSY